MRTAVWQPEPDDLPDGSFTESQHDADMLEHYRQEVARYERAIRAAIMIMNDNYPRARRETLIVLRNALES